MKSDLVTSIAIALFGIIASYFLCNLFAGQSEPYSFKTIDSAAASVELSDPDPEIFNYRALNPTVEVYVGNCVEGGECEETSSAEIDSSIMDATIID